MNDHSTRAAALFCEGYNCAQAVAVAFCDMTGLEPATAARLTSPFGGGMGRMREVCGAFSGMLTVLGLLYGYDDPAATAEKKELYADIQALAEKFRQHSGGSIICREILKLPASEHISAPTPALRTEAYYAARPCERMVMTAAALLDEYIETKSM